MTEAKRVLILEDDFVLAESWAGEFRARGIEVTVAFSRQEAEIYAASDTYDGLVSDLFIAGPNGQLTGDGGITLIAHLRWPGVAKDNWGSNVPIIAVTGAMPSFGVDYLDHARAAGADHTLQKPCTPEALVNLMQAIWRRTAGTTDNAANIQNAES